MKLDVSERTLASFLATPQEQLSVPLYQRPYSWTHEEVDQLWEDITTQLSSEHFMGSIVLNDEEELRPQIIDGQQRLTTLLMLLALIRDAYLELQSPFAGRAHNLLTADLWTETDARFKLRLGAANREVFTSFFLSQPGDARHKSWNQLGSLTKEDLAANSDLLRNARLLRDLLNQHLGTTTGETRIGRLVALEEKLSKRLLFVVIRVGNVEDAFLLFETLNDRGLQLSAADLVKSHLLSRIENEKGPGQVAAAAIEWSELVESLRGSDIGRFMRYYLLMYEPKVQMDRVFGFFKKRIGEETASGLLDHLKEIARLFGEFIQPTLISDVAVKDVIEDINDLRAPTTYVAILPARRALLDNPKDFVRFARLAEALAYRWTTIAGKNAQQLESIFQSAGHLLASQGHEGLAEAESILIDAMPSRAEFVDAFRTKRLGTAYTARYTLRRIEEVLSDSHEWMLKSPAKVNLEHIMPQHLATSWIDDLGPAAAEIHADNVGRWGNLTLLSEKINKSLQDAPFHDKLKTYGGSPGSKIEMTQLLNKETTWGAREVANRQRWLAELADQIWSAEFATGGSKISIPDYPFIDLEEEIDQILALIADHESAGVEFKSTFRINLHTGERDPEIEKAIGKTICAFSNGQGGTLLVGVSDDSEVTGIEIDLESLRNTDSVSRWLGDFVGKRIDPIVAATMQVSYVPLQGKTVCRIDVRPAASPMFFTDGSNERFFVRVLTSTLEYSGNALLDYSAERWPEG